MDRSRPPKHQQLASATSTSRPPTSIPSNSVAVPKETVKRKPVPGSTHSSPATSQNPSLPYSNDPSKPQPPPLQPPPTLPAVATSSPILAPRDLDQYPRGFSPQANHNNNGYFPPITQANQESPSQPGVAACEIIASSWPISPGEDLDDEPAGDPAMIAKTPRSPGPNKLTSFFGWKTSPTPVAETSPTSNSDRSLSPVPSPLTPLSQSTAPSKPFPGVLDTKKANATMNGTFFADTGFPLPPMNGHNALLNGHVDDLEEELKEVSAELAGSIRREMELEELIDRMQFEVSQGPDLGRRTSDYFSDSGSGSTRYPGSDAGINKADDLAKQKRQSEQEKAQFKLGLSQKLQNERDRRKSLEDHIRQMSEQMENMDQERTTTSDNRLRELENSLEDHRRRLQQEKTAKENFEDILDALKGEISQYRDERDNLRDEIVPQLKSRVEGLEAEATEAQKLTYDSARMQQELQSLKNENTTLMNARRMQLEMQQQSSRFNAIAEEGGPSPTEGIGLGLSRSASTTRGSGMARAGSLKRSNSVSSKEREFNERVKDIEMQRDALHKALKLLLERQGLQKKEHEKSIHILEAERDRALQNQSPRRMGYEKEVKGLKFEIDHLRKRADDALQQKFQCETGLGGLKKDLDRAEQETSSLRYLLQEHDIQFSGHPGSRSQEIEHEKHATSTSLEKAYRELQRTQTISISKLRELHGAAASGSEDADTTDMMDKLVRSMSNAAAERDLAQKQAAMFRAEADSLKETDTFHTDENSGLSDQLRAAASRIETLSQQVRNQLDGNSNLRDRLAEAVNRGEKEQKRSTTRINSLQGRLKDLEDKLMNAQQHSEEAFAQHEDEVRDIQDSHNVQLHRLKTGLRLRTGSTLGSPRMSNPMSPIFTARSPKLDRTTSGVGRSLDQALRTEFLEKRVAELEAALGEADTEMEEVVSRMNLAQIEVMELQSARDDAMRQTRRLQTDIDMEREKVDSFTKGGFFKR
ncbi:uncharacterized protein KY384_002085 [Bacidia gigantensis]|uniref:uncharacterized protein n=1 Tax=Bacidia gigantensis TaxID=2732470 RepID=UPI001D03A027|nr:uncharacterized protein KY384_002085 [Bacidia gigantensis]KAG8533302.1 hypothetical protein KY384_002085 [Bacidia gigantensis]